MNKLIISGIVIAVLSMLAFITPAHPVYGIVGMVTAFFTIGFGLAQMDEQGLLN